MRLSIGVAALMAPMLAAAAQRDGTVEGLVTLVRTSLHDGKSDKAIAKEIHRVVLAERLEDRVIEELQSEGAGAESVEEMILLRDGSGKLSRPAIAPRFESPARPDPEEQKRFFKQLSTNAFRYTASLPDFICTEVVHRNVRGVPSAPSMSFGGRMGRGMPAMEPPSTRWQPKDVLTLRLSYADNREKYELVMVNGRKTTESFESVGGAISQGEFASTLLEVFSPESGSQFRWDHWTHLRKRLTRVYSFTGTKEKSHYRVSAGTQARGRTSIVVGRHGFVYADDETTMLMRITVEADSIPRTFPVTGASSVLDYDFADVGGRKFLLPLRAETRMDTERLRFRNVVEFRGYRKFTGESSISFETSESEK